MRLFFAHLLPQASTCNAPPGDEELVDAVDVSAERDVASALGLFTIGSPEGKELEY